MQTGGLVAPQSGVGIAADSGPMGVAAPGENYPVAKAPNVRIGY